MAGGEFPDLFKQAQLDQTDGKLQGEYTPVSSLAWGKSATRYQAIPKSLGIQVAAARFQQLTAPIVFLFGSAKVMFLAGEESGVSGVAPSEVFGAVSDEFLELLDGALFEAPIDLLVIRGAGGMMDLSCIKTKEELEKHARSIDTSHAHSLWLREVSLMCTHGEKVGTTGFKILRRALLALDAIGLFHGEDVSLLAIDMFPSLGERCDELIGRRQMLRQDSEPHPMEE